ncbi:hypothetical protein JW933_11140 [candidate division FCPU426 bacterium]|nr:hypothetical protein [candidate division FCPU426 bacterium]
MMVIHILLFCGQIIWLAAVVIASLGVGCSLLRRLNLKGVQAVTESALALGLGLGILSYLVFLLSALHLLSYAALSVLTGLWIAVGFILIALLPPPPLIFEATLPMRSRWCRLLLLFLSLHLLFNLLSALTPAWDWDGIAYHLALPKIYLQEGGFVFRPDIYHNLFPQMTEMLFLLGLVFPYGSAAKLIHFFFGILAALSVYSLGRENKFATTALLGAVVFYAQYLVHIESGTAFIDLATAAYTGLALLAMLQAYRSQIPGWYYLSALMAGLAAATKWHGLILLALIASGLLLCLWLYKTAAAGRKLYWSAGIILWGSLPVWPYLLRAWFLGRNPIWPLGYAFFGGRDWNSEAAGEMTAFVGNFAGVAKGWIGFLRLPYDLFMSGQAFGAGGPELRFPLLGGCILIIACAFLLWKKSRQCIRSSFLWKESAYLIVSYFLFLSIWFSSSPQIRYLLPLLPLLSFGAAWTLRRLWSEKSWAKAAAIAAGALLFLVHPPIHRDTWEQVKVVFGATQPDRFLSSRLTHHMAVRFLNKAVADKERVLLFKENRGFYLDVDYLWGDPLNQAFIDYRRLDTPASLLNRLRELDVTWVLCRLDIQYDKKYYSPRILQLMEGLLNAVGKECYRDQHVAVYRLLH